jgi:hydrogenase nickel incorporation protein HypA/HybF
MHEVSIALSLLEIVEKKCREEGYPSVESLRVRIGKGSGILPEALQFAFEAARHDTVARNAELILDLIPVQGICRNCAGRFEWETPYILECPFCHSASFQVISGREMDLVEMEVR